MAYDRTELDKLISEVELELVVDGNAPLARELVSAVVARGLCGRGVAQQIVSEQRKVQSAGERRELSGTTAEALPERNGQFGRHFDVLYQAVDRVKVAVEEAAANALEEVRSIACLTVQDKRTDSPYKKDDKGDRAAPISKVRALLEPAPSAVFRGATVLGEDAEYGTRVTFSDQDANHHALIVGSTGTGKTVTGMNIIESHIVRGIPVVFLDGKGDVGLGRRIKAFAETQGRPAFLFHHQATGGRDDACAYNPFSSSDPTALANLVTTLREWTEPHYEIPQKGFMQTVFKTAAALGEPFNLLTISKLMSVSAMTTAVRKHKHRIPHAQLLMEEIQDQRVAEENGIESLAGLIKNLARSSLGPLFDTSGSRPVLKLAEARKTGAVAYFALPALVFPDLSKALGQLVINDIRLTLASDRGPWLIVLDEISTYAGQQMLALINQGRGFDARVVLLGQSFSDLEKATDSGDGKAFRNQILASVNTLIVHRLNGPDDAELASQFAGTFLKPEVTAQTVGSQPTGAGSVRMTREFNVGPDRFKTLERGEAIITSKSGRSARKIRARLSQIDKQ